MLSFLGFMSNINQLPEWYQFLNFSRPQVTFPPPFKKKKQNTPLKSYFCKPRDLLYAYGGYKLKIHLSLLAQHG